MSGTSVGTAGTWKSYANASFHVGHRGNGSPISMRRQRQQQRLAAMAPCLSRIAAHSCSLATLGERLLISTRYDTRRSRI